MKLQQGMNNQTSFGKSQNITKKTINYLKKSEFYDDFKKAMTSPEVEEVTKKCNLTFRAPIRTTRRPGDGVFLDCIATPKTKLNNVFTRASFWRKDIPGLALVQLDKLNRLLPPGSPKSNIVQEFVTMVKDASVDLAKNIANQA